MSRGSVLGAPLNTFWAADTACANVDCKRRRAGGYCVVEGTFLVMSRLLRRHPEHIYGRCCEGFPWLLRRDWKRPFMLNDEAELNPKERVTDRLKVTSLSPKVIEKCKSNTSMTTARLLPRVRSWRKDLYNHWPIWELGNRSFTLSSDNA